MPRTAIVTGASAGIGAATARSLSKEGFDVIVAARRLDRLAEIAAECRALPLALDVTRPESVAEFADAVPRADVLVNNAGMARGRERIDDLADEAVEEMWQTNVAGVLRMTRALLPKLRASANAHIVNVGSIAGFDPYPGGAGYTASKHALRAITKTLRLELLGEPIRVTDVSPGLVETEFSLVRFEGDAERARQPYEGMTPLTPHDVAECIAWAVTRPAHVNIDEIVVLPREQAGSSVVHRSSPAHVSQEARPQEAK